MCMCMSRCTYMNVEKNISFYDFYVFGAVSSDDSGKFLPWRAAQARCEPPESFDMLLWFLFLTGPGMDGDGSEADPFVDPSYLCSL